MYFRTFVQTYISTNLFVKPDEQSQACLSFAMARKRCHEMERIFREVKFSCFSCFP